MKHIRILLIVTLVASMSSCSLSHQTATTRTARSFEIETDIKQMPTVADLVVDSFYVREDTAWTNIMFKYTVTKASMRNELIGEILEKNEADILVQPREKTTTTVYHPFKQSYTMEIFGYPARYRNFRTATEEDLRILNGIDPQPVNYNTIYIGGGYTSGQPVTSALTQAITQPQPTYTPREKKAPYERNKYIGVMEMGYNWLVLVDGQHQNADNHGFMFNFNNFFKAKNPNIYQGIGVGLNAAFGSYHIYSYGHSYNYSTRNWYVPVYYTPRFFFGQRKCIPFFDFRIGFFMGASELTSDYWASKNTAFMGGMYYGAFLGMEFGKHFDFAFGTDQFLGGMVDANSVLFNLTVTAKVAVCF